MTVKPYSLLLTVFFFALSFFSSKYIWESPKFRIVLGLFGGITFIGLFSQYLSNIKTPTYVEYLGQQTLGIYLLQGLILESFLPIFLNFDYLNKRIFDLFVAPLIAIVVMFVCATLIYCLKKYPTVSSLLLGAK